jgi:hypothetical protein
MSAIAVLPLSEETSFSLPLNGILARASVRLWLSFHSSRNCSWALQWEFSVLKVLINNTTFVQLKWKVLSPMIPKLFVHTVRQTLIKTPISFFQNLKLCIYFFVIWNETEVRGFESWWGHSIFFNFPNPFSRTMAPNRSEYQKMFLVIQRGWHVTLTTSPPSVSRMPRQCGILNISQRYRPPQPLMGAALRFLNFTHFLIVNSKQCSFHPSFFLSPWSHFHSAVS